MLMEVDTQHVPLYALIGLNIKNTTEFYLYVFIKKTSKKIKNPFDDL
jgi:hypothetical protein